MIWVRVMYKRKGTGSTMGPWNYGWVFPSADMMMARGTITNVGGKKCDYHFAEVLDCDFDHPMNRGTP